MNTATQFSNFFVRESMCDQCLFSKNKVVGDARKEQIIKSALKKDSYFICHKSDNICCRGFYNVHKKDTLIIRLATILKNIIFTNGKDR